MSNQSGSTSDPKGCMNSHHSVALNVHNMQLAVGTPGIGPQQQTIVDWVPHFHDYGLICNVSLIYNSLRWLGALINIDSRWYIQPP